ncbi:hypothetical protein WICMUC_003993 [Wickerhamomyces mucosus]|uniref:Alcohol dehydrogenase-like C-terminal domain-containing protein n=1 Tax=Wickerhamomyces mucosus TaxID=1378264 RepID=A0A9P8TC63_9ASCO|nr:hypothetical protein WICMUC_003993 [Wickerhamomyces mucosus]
MTIIGASQYHILNLQEIRYTSWRHQKGIFVFAAGGAVGWVLVHILANLFNPKNVLTATGTDKKIELVEISGPNVIGLNFKSPTYQDDFVTALDGDEIDIFLDQAGGNILDHTVNSIKSHGVQVSEYDNEGKLDFNKFQEDIVDATGEAFIEVPEI